MLHTNDGRHTATDCLGWRPKEMNEQDLHALCQQYGQWCRTRRYFTPPVPSNLLSRFHPRDRIPIEPDAELLADMPFFNMAVKALSDDYPRDGICFTLYHIHGFRPVKAVAAALGIGRRTFYERMQRFSEKAFRLSVAIKEARCRDNPNQAHSTPMPGTKGQ